MIVSGTYVSTWIPRHVPCISSHKGSPMPSPRCQPTLHCRIDNIRSQHPCSNDARLMASFLHLSILLSLPLQISSEFPVWEVWKRRPRLLPIASYRIHISLVNTSMGLAIAVQSANPSSRMLIRYIQTMMRPYMNLYRRSLRPSLQRISSP